MPLPHLFEAQIRACRQAVPGPIAGDGMVRVARLADRAARSAAPVLIEGEPGTGAEALARAIHLCGERKDQPFIRFHGGATSDSLAEKLVETKGGTLVVHAVPRLSSEEQSLLLCALQNREIDPSASRRPLRFTGRMIAVADSNLIDDVREGRFREDLFYRLQTLSIALPPLRAERDSLAPIARFLLARFAEEEGKRVTGMTADAEHLLLKYDWPGNLRQLENALLRAVLLADGSRVTVAEFPQIAAKVGGYRIDVPPAPSISAPLLTSGSPSRSDPHSLRMLCESGEMRTLEKLEAEIIRFALNHYQGQMSVISRKLGIGRSTLYRKLKELGLESDVADIAV